MRLVREADGCLEQPPLTLDPDVEGAVDHDLSDAVVGEEPLEGPVAEDVVGDLRRQPLAVVAREARLLSETSPDVRSDPVAQRVRVHIDVEELRSQIADDRQVDLVLEFRERVLPEGGCDRRRRRESLVEFHLVPLPVMPSSFWVASTKPEAALVRGQG